MPIEPIGTVTSFSKFVKFLNNYWLHIAIVILTLFCCWFVNEWFEQRKENKLLKESLKSKQAVVDLTSQRQVREVEINNETEQRIDELEKNQAGNTAPMSPAVRSAIDSLY